jgi:phosphatidylserine/phosphatidylglycerophosphate/cardiolipin synthase-like enzyme
MLETGVNCWRIEQAERAALVVDAANYFRVVRKAMLDAREQILLIGWDFDTRIDLDPEETDAGPTQLGPFISWIAKRRPELSIHILKWDIGVLYLLGRGSTLFRVASWARKPNIHFKLDSAHALGATHHQKIVVIDDRLAFCGGIDMTAARWDTREHKDKDPYRRTPTLRRRYRPWHDATMAVSGPAARALGELARDRWAAAGGDPIEAPRTDECRWPEDLKPDFKNVELAISRTRGAHAGEPAIREIERLFVDQIARAKRYIYAENQYFASRVIAKAILNRLSEPDCPEIVIVNPKTGLAWLDDEAMSPARERLIRTLGGADRKGRFYVYSPLTEEGEDIYVHSKILIVDDEILRVGSANMNNRSMGLDSECDLTIDTSLNDAEGCGERIAGLQADLLAEHLGCAASEVTRELGRTSSISQTIAALGAEGRRLVRLELPGFSHLEHAIAEKELLDPEASREDFEPMVRPGLLTGMRRKARLAWRRNRRSLDAKRG